MTKTDWHYSISDGISAMPHPDDPFWGVVLQRGSLEIGLYAPESEDSQTPHDQDEVYIIAAGQGTFVREEESCRFATGDILFVPAGAAHRFENFSDDFRAWVIFYGPSGGETI